MNSRLRTIGISLGTLMLVTGLSLSSVWAADKAQTFTGEVSDSMCGAKHAMPGDKAACTRACVSKGSKYALVSGSKVYTLDAKDKDSLAQLDKLAGEQATVTGTANADTIEVKSVASAK
jgi:hypothetical protein